jgi:transketolase
MTYEQILEKIALNDDRVIVMTAENRAAIRNLPKTLGNRFIDTGITEQTLIGSAAGLALRGRIPVVHALATFLTMRAFEFIRTDIGISHAPVKLVGYVPGFLSEANGPTHQAIEDVALMRSIPGMRVFCPADLEDLVIGLETVLKDPHPWYIRYNDKPAVIEHNDHFAIGKSEVIQDGKEIGMFVYGPLLREAHAAVNILESKGYGVRLVNMRSLEPVDEEEILRTAESCEFLVTIEDHLLRGGLYSIIAEILFKHQTITRVIPFGLDNKWFKPSLLDNIIEYEGFSGEQIAENIMDNLSFVESYYAQFNTV